MKKLSGSRLANLIVITAVLIVPLLYAGLLTLAYQNPTNRLDQIKAAVVNDDTPYTATLASGDSETLALGNDITQVLTHPDADTDTGFTWQAMSADEAQKKMRSEDIRAILYIPEGFSQKASLVASSDPNAATTQSLELVTDDGINYLTGTMARTVAATLANRLENEGSQKILAHTLMSISTIRDGMVSAAEGAQSLADGSATLRDGTHKAASGASELSAGAHTLKVGLTQLADGSVTLAQGLVALDTGTQRAHAGANALENGLAALDAGTRDAAEGSARLAHGAHALDNGADTLKKSAAPLAEGIALLSGGSSTLADGITTYTRGVDRASAGASALREKASDPTRGLEAGIAALSAGIGHEDDTAGSKTSLYGGINSLADGATSLAEGMTTPRAGSPMSLTEGAAQVADGLTKLNTALASVDTSQITKAASGSSTLADGISTYSAGIDRLAQACEAAKDSGTTCQTLRALSAQSEALRAGSRELAAGLGTASTQLTGVDAAVEHVAALRVGAEKVSEGIKEAAKGASTLAQGASTLRAAMPAIRTGIDTLQSGIGTGNSADPTTVMGAISALDDGLRAITAPANSGGQTIYVNSERLRGGSGKVAAGAATMNEKMPELRAGVTSLAQGTHSLAEGASSLNNGMTRLSAGSHEASLASRTLNEGLARLTKGNESATKGAHTLSTGLKDADSGATRLNEGAATLAQGNTALDEGASQLADGAHTLATGLKEGAQKIPNYSDSQRDTMSTVGAKVASVEAVRDHAVANNGAGFTPMFMSLALWIGAIALFLILPALDKRDHGEKWWASAIRPATTAVLLAIAQAVIMMIVVDASAGIGAKNLPGLCLMAIASSITFMLINQACVASLAFRGRFISIILLSLQITSMGATFPVETAPAFFQWIHPFLPMSYTQLAFRDLIAGSGAQGAIGNALAVLGIWAALAVLVILIGARIRRGPHPLPADNALAPTAA